MVTVALILTLQRTPLRSLGLVVAVVVGSRLGMAFGAFGAPVQRLADIVDVPRTLPLPVLPAFAEIPGLLLPGLSLALVGLVQGTGVSAEVPIVLLGGVIGSVAMPALAGLLIVIGAGSIRLRQVLSVARTGAVQLTVSGATPRVPGCDRLGARAGRGRLLMPAQLGVRGSCTAATATSMVG